MPSATSPNFKIIGLDELNQLITNLPTAWGNIFMQAGSQYAKSVYDKAYKIVPVKTGRLRSSLGFNASKTETRIYATAPYAAAVNYGTYRMPGRPYLTGPAEEFEAKLMTDLENGLMNYLRSGSSTG